MPKNKLSKYLIAGGMATVGLIAGVAAIAGAQTTSVTSHSAANVTTATNQTVDTPEPGDVPDTGTQKTHQHAPLGGDGVVSSVNGTTIVMSEESNEGGALYNIDASKATFTVNGIAGSVSDVKVGGKILVQGTTNGTNVTATSVSIGHSGRDKNENEANDTDGSAVNEASETSSGSTSN